MPHPSDTMLSSLSARDATLLAPQRTKSSLNEDPSPVSDTKTPLDAQDATADHDTPNETELRVTRKRAGTYGHQRIVFCDPVAFRYLEEDPATTVLERRGHLQGYEAYLVEQWVCSRSAPTFIICAYTGDMSHSIQVSVLGVPVDESAWSLRLKTYFKAVNEFYARKRDTSLGTLMVTNLSSFPSALTVIPIPHGDVKGHRDVFMVNENLKRMGCAGRAGINLQKPQASTESKFHHLYRTSEIVPLFYSVMEVVKLCQIALNIFGKLPQAYIDGLLCDKTEQGINEWWADIGTHFYNLEPIDGILGPTTVAGLLGLLLGAYNRLNTVGTPAGKDVLDIESMKRAIGTFQKMNRLERTRRLDRQTLDRLHRNTAKTAASNDKWTVGKTVKSTVAELSGKGGEMVMGIVGGRDKAGIAEVETLDLDHFTQLITGPRMKWLWQGKPIKSAAHDSVGAPLDDLNGRVFSTDEQGGFLWTSPKRESVADVLKFRRTESNHIQPDGEGRSGFGRIKDAVRPQIPRQITEHPGGQMGEAEPGSPVSRKTSKDTKYTLEHKLRPSPSWHGQPSEKLFRTDTTDTMRSKFSTSTTALRPARRTAEDQAPTREQLLRPERSPEAQTSSQRPQLTIPDLRQELQSEKYQNFRPFETGGLESTRLRRSRSAVQLVEAHFNFARRERLPRHLSFSSLENSLLPHGDAAREVMNRISPYAADESDPREALRSLDLLQAVSQKHGRRVMGFQQALVPYAQSMVANVEGLDAEAGVHLEELNNWYYQRLDEYQALRATSTDVVADEKARLTDALRRLEGLGAKLDYELTALQSRIQEVEDGVEDFERSVVDIEGKVRDLTVDEGRRGYWAMEVMRFVCGRGTGSGRGRGSISS